MPWKEELLPEVRSNYDIALSVLSRVNVKLNKSGHFDKYMDVFQQQLDSDIIEEFHVEPKDYGKHIWVPHRPVIKNDSQCTTKIRPVFNCSLRVNQSVSLNMASYQGVDLMSNLLQLIFKFRCNFYTLLADIKKAFLMIRLSKLEDKNRFCFFLVKDNMLRTFRYNTILFGYVASPFILNFVIKHHVSRFVQDEYSKMLMSHFYVDNLLYSTSHIQTLFDMYTSCYDRMAAGGFELRSWSSNYEPLQQQLQVDGRSVEHSEDCEKVLGYLFFPSSDSFKIAFSQPNDNASTKRAILSEIAKFFDPIGFCLPVLIRAKILLRELWAAKLEWDTPIGCEFSSTWRSICKDLESISSFMFPRYTFNEDEPCKLCVFCDASKTAYGFTIYAIQGSSCNLFFAKSKVAPMQARTLPTLELLSVFFAFKCLPTVLSSISKVKIQELIFGVDAQVVLSWLLTGVIKTKNQFANNRLKDINVMIENIKSSLDCSLSFKYVPTQENPADFLTRGLSSSKFEFEMNTWLHGPAWLTSSSWPTGNLNCLSKENQLRVHSEPSSTFNTVVEINPVQLLEFSRFSSYSKLYRTVFYIFKFLKLKCQILQNLDIANSARIYLLKTAQQACFSEEIRFLTNPTKSTPSLVNTLKLFLDKDGLLRSKSRLDKASSLEQSETNPILLPKSHPLSKLIILHFHHRMDHLSTASTLLKLRQSGFWIPQGRQSVSNALKSCFICRKMNAVAYPYPPGTDLPASRVNLHYPYKDTGIDFSGTISVNCFGKQIKMYILIFTCLATRAVHLELLPSMTISDFVLAFTRFASLYGVPSCIHSDNAKTFVAAGEFLTEALQSELFLNKYGHTHLQHIRNPAYSPWFGAVFERLFRTIKSCLRKTIGRGPIEYFQLLTLLADVKWSINSRPLTYVETEQDYTILTPNHFLHPLAPPEVMIFSDRTPTNFDKITRKELLKTLETRQKLYLHFEKVWNESYLLYLKEREKGISIKPFKNRVREGDVVLIKHPLKTRSFWTLGRVTAVYPGYDGNIRTVMVKRGDGNSQIYCIKHLYPLDFCDALPEEIEVESVDLNDSVDSSSSNDITSSSRNQSFGDSLPNSTSLRSGRKTKPNIKPDYFYF